MKNYDEITPGELAVVYMNQEGAIATEPFLDFSETTFPIIAVLQNGYSLYVYLGYDKEYVFSDIMDSQELLLTLTDNSKIDPNYKFKIADNFHSYNGKYARWVPVRQIHSCVSRTYARKNNEPDGCNCRTCKEFYPMAAPNQSDGKTLICYSCRQNPMRGYY